MTGLGDQQFQLPNRRVSRCEKVVYRLPADPSRPADASNSRAEHRFYIRCGFHPDGSVREIFFAAKRETMDLMEVLSDVCILISQQLQSGARLSDLAVQAPRGFIGTIIAAAIKVEAECADDVRALYAARPA